ncbi:GntR family transcriptional regulator [Virgibacillus dokdonensis]|uniref:GntR family transcriptional regulator n=1 Tax=Virgibacillus dokdonensis TaxID=302167 RepID=A0A2K9IV64_9BACI|nr:GntR family transcriptional regulator [Virgibacillus dokdonensis]AUJ23669.1 Mannosyl-D-glycerate transport/metabolism system repressor MngR [Virgibacillus dokdonensis]
MKLTMKKGPLYLQVQDILKERIINGVYPKGELIPSELELKDEFEVSLITVRRAVEQLSNQGYVEKKSGIGTIVLDNHAVSKLSKGQRFSEYLISQGFNLKKEFASLKIIKTTEGSILEKNFGKQCYCLERLYTLEERPYIHFNHYIPITVILPDEPEQLLNSLYEILFQQGIKFNQFKDEFAVEVPEATIADRLQVESKPLLQRIRYSYDLNEQLFEYSVAFYNTSVHKYVVNFDV